MKEKVILKKGKYYFKLDTILSALEVKLEESVIEDIAYFSAEFSSLNDDIQNRREEFIRLITISDKEDKETISDEEKRAIIIEDVAVLINDYQKLKNHYFILREQIKDKGTVVEFIDQLMDELTNTINNYYKYINKYIDESNIKSKDIYREIIKLESINNSIKSILKGGSFFYKTYILNKEI